MSVYRVLDKLEAYVHEGTWLPAGYRVLSEERLVEFVEKIRSTLPEEVGRAKIIAKDQDRMIRAAQEKAQSIVSEASITHEQLVGQNEIVQRARTTAETVLREAEARAQKIRDDLRANLPVLPARQEEQNCVTPRPTRAPRRRVHKYRLMDRAQPDAGDSEMTLRAF